MRGRLLILTGVLALMLPPGVASGQAPDDLRLRADFNGDGFADLAVGNYSEGLSGMDDAGAVNVIYGSASGLTSAGNQLWHQNTPGIADVVGRDDHFSESLGTGDFNGDGKSDLAIGVSQETVNGKGFSGALHVLYGSSSGLSAFGSQYLHQDSPGVLDQAEGCCEGFGFSSDGGDFDADGFDDLAIGVPGESVSGVDRAGAVHVLYGGPGGLSAEGDQLFHQNTTGIPSPAEFDDSLGGEVEAADYDGDGRDDLAVAASGEDLAGGAVNVLYGSAGGLSASRGQLWSQGTEGIQGDPEADDRFAIALGAGDYNDDGRADLAVGVWLDRVAGTRTGSVNVIRGSASGLTPTADKLLHQDVEHVEGEAQDSERFGANVAAADVNADGVDDMVVGVPFDGQFGPGTGSVQIFRGARGQVGGVTVTRDQLLGQDSPGIQDQSEFNEGFAKAVFGADFNGDGFTDVSVGVPHEFVAPFNHGALNAIYGGPDGLTSTGAQFFHQGSPGILDSPESGDAFGFTLVGSHGT